MRDFAREHLYEWVERSVLGKRRGFSARGYLLELANAYEELAATYRAQRVVVDYATPGFVEAYRLHYLPHYVYTAFRAFTNMPEAIYAAVADGTCIVGAAAAGPLPEIIALAEHCAIAGVSRGRIRLDAFDVAASVWHDAALESITLAKRLHPGLEISLNYHSMDFRSRERLEIPAFHLLSFQHCANEFAVGGTLAPGAVHLIGNVLAGGALVFSDFTQYAETVSTIRKLEMTLDEAAWRARAKFEPLHLERTPFWRIPYETYFGFYEYDYPEAGALWREPRRFSPRRNLRFSWSSWSPPKR